MVGKVFRPHVGLVLKHLWLRHGYFCDVASLNTHVAIKEVPWYIMSFLLLSPSKITFCLANNFYLVELDMCYQFHYLDCESERVWMAKKLILLCHL
jgi:hypothetical protein